MIPEIGVMVQQKVKKKKTCFNAHYNYIQLKITYISQYCVCEHEQLFELFNVIWKPYGITCDH